MPLVIQAYEQDKELRLREDWATAQLEAALRNALGGKPKPGAKPKADADEFLPYETADVLPPWSKPAWLVSGPHVEPLDIHPGVARGLVMLMRFGLLTGESLGGWGYKPKALPLSRVWDRVEASSFLELPAVRPLKLF